MKDLTLIVLIFIQLIDSHMSLSQSFTRIEHQAKLNEMVDCNGVAVADYDGDNDLDVFIVARQDGNLGSEKAYSKLYRNNNDGTFSDMTIASGISSFYDYQGFRAEMDIGLKMGASWGDFDNDGYPDLFLTSIFHIQLYKNNGDGTFSDHTLQGGFESDNDCHNVGATWFDYNNDGWLDVYLTKWGGCSTNRLFKNNADGTFTDVTEAMGITDVKNEEYTWMSMPIDVNEDGLLDLYVAHDFNNFNRLYVNNGENGFTEQAAAYGLEDFGHDAMGLTVGDYNNDGRFDIYVTNISLSSFFENKGEGFFVNRANELEAINSGWAWGTQFADFDHDGDEDLMIVNGYGTKTENYYYKNLLKEGDNRFEDESKEQSVAEKQDSNGLAVFDYDNDGDLDMLVSNSNDKLAFYENHISEENGGDRNWIRIDLEGTDSNRDAIGAVVQVNTADGNQFRFHSGADYLAQNLQPLHFGLGNSNVIAELIIKWPSGLEETYSNLPVNKTISVTEGSGFVVLDLKANKIPGCNDPKSCNYNPNSTVDDGSCQYLESKEINGKALTGNLRSEIYSYPLSEGSEYQWVVEGGKIIEGFGTEKIKIEWGIGQSGIVSVREFNGCYSEQVQLSVTLTPVDVSGEHSIARLWNEALLEAIRNDYARPTVHARNLFHASIAMYDSWALFDDSALPYLIDNTVHHYTNNFEGFDTDMDKQEAVETTLSYAVYRLLSFRFRDSPSAETTLQNFDELMKLMAFDVSFTSTNYSSGDPAALGNFIGESIINYGLTDGAREFTKYDNTHYQPANPSLIPGLPGNSALKKPNRWQPLELDVFIDQAGNPVAGSTPEFLSPEWGNVKGFALSENGIKKLERDGDSYIMYHDPGEPPYLDTLSITNSSELYQWNFSLVSIWSAQLDPSDGVMWDISPKNIGNIDFDDLPKELSEHDNFYDSNNGGDISKGRTSNPTTGQPYEEQIVPRGDYARVLAEFWADGPDSETPPGHWFVLFNHVNDHPEFEKKFEGTSEVLDDLEWDVKAYFTLGGAMHDAAISAWSIKGWYDYIRPISAIRYMAERGQSSDPSTGNYDVAGIPLVEDYIEVVSEIDAMAGENYENAGKIKLYAWKGHSQIINTETDGAGVGWILAENWWPYQRPSFVTPPFAGYVSGHSTYSRAAAEVMTLMTGSEYFPGGMGEFLARKNEFLVFEEGPSVDVKLQWATYRDASDQCSLSRIWGGIHPPADDIPGRLIGEKIGKEAFNFAEKYFHGKVLGIDKLTDGLTVYPNPINGKTLKVNNTLSNQRFNVFDIRGRQVPINSIRFDLSTKTTSIMLGDLSRGVYILSTHQQNFKIIVN